MTDQDLRERLVTLEVEMRHVRQSNDELKVAVQEMRDILTQAKGARWVIIVSAAVGGALITYAPKVATWLGIVR